MTASDTLIPPRIQTVTGAGGCQLHVRDHGPEDAPPVVFLHGLLMNGHAWHHQVAALGDTHRIVTVDLRGHGRSDAPEDGYADSRTWADDLRSVLDLVGGQRPVLVAWSYAGLVAADYLRHYGDDAIGGLCLVAPLRKIGTDEAFALLGGDFLALVEGLLSTDADAAQAATAAFIDLVRSDDWPDTERYERLGGAMAVPATVRGAMLAREVDTDDVWAGVRKPVMIAAGSDDRIITPASTQALGDLIPDARVRHYDGAGHVPFAEQPDQFNQDLRDLIAT